MGDAWIIDAVRTPRGKGKKPDRAGLRVGALAPTRAIGGADRPGRDDDDRGQHRQGQMIKALESLENIITDLHNAAVTFHLAEVKGPVMDKLEKVGFLKHLGNGKVFLSTHDAFIDLNCA